MAAAILCLPVGVVHATSDGPDYLRVRNVKENDVLNVRVEPTPQSGIVGILEPNLRGVSNLGCLEAMDLVHYLQTKQFSSAIVGRVRRGEMWCKVRHPAQPNVVGWVNAQFVMEDTAPPSPVSPPYSVQVGEEGARFESFIEQMVPVGDKKFNVRVKLVTKGSRTPALPNGSEQVDVSLDCLNKALTDPNRGLLKLTISEDLGYLPSRASWDDENLWWAVCRHTFQKYRYDRPTTNQPTSIQGTSSGAVQVQSVTSDQRQAPTASEVQGRSKPIIQSQVEEAKDAVPTPIPQDGGTGSGNPLVDIVVGSKTDPSASKALAAIAKGQLPSINGETLYFDGIACLSREAIVEVSRSSNFGMGQMFPGGNGTTKDIAGVVNRLIASKDCDTRRPAGYVRVDEEDGDYPVYHVRDLRTGDAFWATRSGLK